MATQFKNGTYNSNKISLFVLSNLFLEKDIPISKQSFPGKDHEMPDPEPTRDQLPDAANGATTYHAANKLKGKRAIITGGDSGIGAATAVLFAREGATSCIAYLPDEEKDAQDTQKQVEHLGGVCHLIALDLVKKENCKKVVEFALAKMGGIDILFNNAACKYVRCAESPWLTWI